MPPTEPGLILSQFHDVVGMSRETFKQRLNRRELLLPSWDWGSEPLRARYNKYSFHDALAVELAVSLATNLAFHQASWVVMNSRGTETYLKRSRPIADPHDFWIAQIGGRHTDSDSELYDYVCGDMSEIMSAATKKGYRISRRPPALIVMANVWVADQRVRRRAKELGIEITDDQFASELPRDDQGQNS